MIENNNFKSVGTLCSQHCYCIDGLLVKVDYNGKNKLITNPRFSDNGHSLPSTIWL